MAEYTIHSYKDLKTLGNPSNPQNSYTVDENSIEKNECTIGLIGKNKPNYGETQSENYLHILQNFCSDENNKPKLYNDSERVIGSEPYAIEGQFWYERKVDAHDDPTGAHTLWICNGNAWDAIQIMHASDTAPENPQNGDTWYNSASKKFEVYDSTLGAWVVVGPNDYSHSSSVTDDKVARGSATTTTQSISSILPDSFIKVNVSNDSESSASLNTYGCTALMTAKIIAKEVYEEGTTTYQRSKTWVYKYMTTYNANGGLSLVGSPSYEIIAQQDRGTVTADDWTVTVSKNNLQQIQYTFTGSVPDNYHVVVLFKTDIERV